MFNQIVLPAVLTTAQAAKVLHKKPQTLRAWACNENGPLQPVRIKGRLYWSVEALSKLLNGEVA